ncbi:hypothetical protein [Caulobacter sp. 17J80-11]|uniref:hypothetical protein n=1 Tax=Caulobacter sp. 17J80-11 TaxID=2763502 RepID=UPI001653BA32|nr:hypothetical protein [Caulobacter sp. 17J80-11]MBC6982343.1 hypothetical protein [Caulobacter sp. 17J80-11]
MIARRLFTVAVAAAAFAGGLSWSGVLLPAKPSDLVSQAQAVVGRPATPVSYAGVARRTTRRTVAATAAVTAPVYAAPVAAAAVYAPGCVAVVDSYGRTVYRCP